MTNARDLVSAPPRRWSERLNGICWLPRLIDKARAAQAGTLGDYFFGQSPIDRQLLRTLRLSHRAFAEIVRDAHDDDAVLDTIATRNPEALERARAWSAAMPARNRLFLYLLDVDDGYRASWLSAPVHGCAYALSRTVKRLWPSPR